MKRILLVATTTLLASQAFAADVAIREPVPMPANAIVDPAPVHSWAGFYVGANAGYGRQDVVVTNRYEPLSISPWMAGPVDLVHSPAAFKSVPLSIDPNPSDDGPVMITPMAAQLPSTTATSLDGSGFVGGVQAGYNFQAGSFVYGVEADLQYSGMKQEASGVAARIGWYGTARARVGFTPIDRVLLYATGGLAYGRMEVSDATSMVSSTRTGWTAGAGAEIALDRHWSLKTEYLHTDLGSWSKQHDAQNRSDYSFRFGTVRTGINFRF